MLPMRRPSVYGGHKSDFDGNSKISSFNIHAFPSVYGAKCLGILAQLLPPKGYAEGYHDNTCILEHTNDPYLDVGGVTGADCFKSALGKAKFEDGLMVGNNTIYAPLGQAKVQCGKDTISFTDFQGKGFDAGTTISANMPSAPTIIGWAQELLKAAE